MAKEQAQNNQLDQTLQSLQAVFGIDQNINQNIVDLQNKVLNNLNEIQKGINEKIPTTTVLDQIKGGFEKAVQNCGLSEPQKQILGTLGGAIIDEVGKKAIEFVSSHAAKVVREGSDLAKKVTTYIFEATKKSFGEVFSFIKSGCKQPEQCVNAIKGAWNEAIQEIKLAGKNFTDKIKEQSQEIQSVIKR